MDVTVLKRRKCSGFVQWPPRCGNRILGGNATFQTKCDMLIGPCSCGHIHRETDYNVIEILEDYRMVIELLMLVPKNKTLKIPKYWSPIHIQPTRRCSHLMGKCQCGKTHTGNEPEIKRILRAMSAEISK